jgi:2-polyprenyl-3-methyl-5-hydroxy-6-metoxy-1,4-benzoquinol methylase
LAQQELNKINNMIQETGYWLKESASQHHIHSPNLSKWISKFLEDHKENQIYDFGCGLGNYLKDLENDGFTKLIGLEGDPVNTNTNFEVMKIDLTNPFLLNEKGIVICLEVGEHIPKVYQDIFLKNIVDNCTGFLILSWAVKGQGGHGHVNEMDNDEVILTIENLGFKYLNDVSMDARVYPEDYCSYFRNTIMVFEKII